VLRKISERVHTWLTKNAELEPKLSYMTRNNRKLRGPTAMIATTIAYTKVRGFAFGAIPETDIAAMLRAELPRYCAVVPKETRRRSPGVFRIHYSTYYDYHFSTIP